MITISDIKKLTQVFTTKLDFAELEDKIVTKEDLGQLMTKLDHVYGEIINIRQEQTIH